MTKLVSSSPELKGARKTVSVYMSAREHRDLVKLSKRVGVSYSAIIRRLVTAYAGGAVRPRDLPKIDKQPRMLTRVQLNKVLVKYRKPNPSEPQAAAST